MLEPKRLLKLKHYKGMPIPVTVLIGADGVPDFASLNIRKAHELGRKQKCALCGKGMQKEFAFVGGEMSMASGLFNDGPMHVPCATYSFFICPFVSGAHREYREGHKPPPEGITIKSSPIIPVAKMGMMIVDTYSDRGVDFDHSWVIPQDVTRIILWEEDIRAEGTHEGQA